MEKNIDYEQLYYDVIYENRKLKNRITELENEIQDLNICRTKRNIDLQKFINLNQVVTETASALIGSIAIVICVPFTAVAASQMIKHFSAKNEDINLDCN